MDPFDLFDNISDFDLNSTNQSLWGITGEVIIGATPNYYASWKWYSKALAMVVVTSVLFTNTVVIAIYYNLREKVSMHEIHVCHLAVCDILAALFAAFPLFVGLYKEELFKAGHKLVIPCFVSTMATHAGNLMATIICIIISYDRLRLLQLGIRYHLVNTRRAGIRRLILSWSIVICATTAFILMLTATSLGRKYKECAYVFTANVLIVKLAMTIVALAPVTTLILVNCLVRRKLKDLEEQHPTTLHNKKMAIPGAPSETTDFTEVASGTARSSQTMTQTSQVSYRGEVIDACPRQSPLTSGSESTFSKSANYIRSTLYGRTLSNRATMSIFISTMTFTFSLSPLTTLLLIEAWIPGIIKISMHRWHLWFTLMRTVIDPFLFARCVPSFRAVFGITIIKWDERWCWFRWLRWLICYPMFCVSSGVILEVQERLSRRKHTSPPRSR